MKRRGLSLLETVFASGLLAGVVFMLFNLYPASALAVRRSQDHLQADQIAQTYVALYQAEPFHQLAQLPNHHSWTLSEVSVEGTNTKFKPSIEVLYGPDGSDPDVLRQLRVTVSWDWVRGPQSVTQEIFLVDLEN
ncbi:MAG: hypothetical protein KF760_35525 [Candidatus Eremiobacteraeota bacterium]|nr:hypothetical protein [Candidatus Eremiobacteraeota bacterium]MCW5872061.1 hypothetical protein [Candidatus Eremiobacteraeota bacterium]